MTSREEFSRLLSEEIQQALGGSARYQRLHVGLTGATLAVGGLTTYVTAADTTAAAWVAPALAALTTILGTVGAQTSFRKKYNGYRLTKTELQNLELDLLKVEGDLIDDSFIDRVKAIRSQKVARTTDAG